MTGESDWFNRIAAFLGPAYWAPGTTRVQAFTTGTEQEVDFLVEALDLRPGERVLDVGCGPGRHSLALARRGLEVHGVDLSPDFVALAARAAEAESLPASFEVLDVRELCADAQYDALVCLCQGGFGLLRGEEDVRLLSRFTSALRAGGRLAVSAFSAYFALAHLEPSETFDASTGVLHERARMTGAGGTEEEFDLWTTVFTPRELVLLADAAGLVVEGVHGVAPGRYGLGPPSLDAPEHLLLARRPL